MKGFRYAIIIFSLLSYASSRLCCASPPTFTRRHLSQAPVTGGLPFFPAYGSPSPPSPPLPPPPTPLPPPPALADLTFPANISALVLPSSPKQHTASRTLLIPVISAVLAAATAIILVLFLYGRWRVQTRRHESKNLASETKPPEQAPPPRNTTENKLSVSASASGSRFVKPESPEISPLPPLPCRSFLKEEEDDDEDFYSPQASLASKEQRKNPYSNFSPSPSSTSDFPAIISPERQMRNNKRAFSLWNQSIGFPRVSSASTSPERGVIKTPDAYARSSMYSSVSTTPERFFRKVLETSPPRWNDLTKTMANNAKSTTKKHPLVLLTTLSVLILTVSKPVTSQNCGCASDFCCSKWGYCGQTEDYCGDGCREGPCQGGGGGNNGGGGGDAVSLEETVTPEFFNSIISQARDGCAGKGFYSHNAFIAAANSYPSFGSSISKREIAAFFAHVTHETEFMCYIEEIDGPAKAEDYCDKENTDFPCAPGKGYYGRGPIQLSWNYNYGQCGRDLNENILASPEKVAQDPALAFKTAFWFWTTNVKGKFNQGFGATIRAINGMECSGRNPATVEKRIGYFRDYCGKLGVEPGDNLSC